MDFPGCGCSSGVEHDLAKVGVEGSNPFARSISTNYLAINGTLAGALAPLYPHYTASKGRPRYSAISYRYECLVR
jgi:hypothetical protein